MQTHPDLRAIVDLVYAIVGYDPPRLADWVFSQYYYSLMIQPEIRETFLLMIYAWALASLEPQDVIGVLPELRRSTFMDAEGRVQWKPTVVGGSRYGAILDALAELPRKRVVAFLYGDVHRAMYERVLGLFLIWSPTFFSQAFRHGEFMTIRYEDGSMLKLILPVRKKEDKQAFERITDMSDRTFMGAVRLWILGTLAGGGIHHDLARYERTRRLVDRAISDRKDLTAFLGALDFVSVDKAAIIRGRRTGGGVVGTTKDRARPPKRPTPPA